MWLLDRQPEGSSPRAATENLGERHRELEHAGDHPLAGGLPRCSCLGSPNGRFCKLGDLVCGCPKNKSPTVLGLS